MEPVNTLDTSDLEPLRNLAGEFLAAKTVAFGVLDRIATVAADLAARGRERARQQVLDLVEAHALPLFPGAASDLRSRLVPLSLDELSHLATLLERAVTARAAFEEADSGLMAARRRGDYAAMAPLALEADAQKTALESVSSEIAERLGIDDLLPDEAVTGEEPAAAAVLAEAASIDATPSEPAPAADAVAPDAAATAAAEPYLVQDVPPDLPEAQPERRRLRALIRQMRPASEEVPVTR